MRIAHASDLHGKYEILDRVGEPPDLWCLTGDIFPYMRLRDSDFWGNPKFEVPHQLRWFGNKAGSFARRLGDRPVLLVPGNHDFADLAVLLRRAGVDAREVTPDGLEFQGVRFAGFGHVPYFQGKWNREVHDLQLRDLSYRTITVGNPTVLLTHAPPGNILSHDILSHDIPGIYTLQTALTYTAHNVRVHLFGHIHECGGKMVEHMGIRFFNSATTLQVFDL